MSFNGLQPSTGPFFIAPGASLGIVVWFGDPGDDRGAQWIMAHPIQGEPPTSLRVTDFTKSLDYSIGTVTENGDPVYGYDPNSAYYRYGVTVTNLGNSGVHFNVQGGGNS
jgi:hypothetical protein